MILIIFQDAAYDVRLSIAGKVAIVQIGREIVNFPSSGDKIPERK